PKSSEDEVVDDAGKKNGVLDPTKEDDKSGQREATNTNRLNTISSSINTVSSSFTTIDPGRERAQRNEFESVFGQDKDANGNSIYKMFTPVNAAGSSCDNHGGSIPINAATLPNVDLPTDSLMPEDTTDLLNTGFFSGAYDDEYVGAEADLNNLEITMNMDVKSAFLYGTIKEEVYVYQTPSFEDPQFPDKVYKVEKALYVLHQAPKAWYETLSTYLLENGFKRGTIDKTLFIKKDKDDAQEIPDEFYRGAHFLLRVAVKTTSTPIETNKAFLKDEEAEDVDVYLYRSMIRSFMYLTTSRPDIMFAVCACARDSPFDLEAFSDSDYARASLDRKSTTKGCQFLGKRLISWQCKKQTIVANSTTEAKYVAAANCCGQVLWIQN
ncbi:putative ribonuclease H-like domain-containing protein, partial [Tanacetum coccineum]